jgi:cytochrome c-type biogenesis protein CcmE
MERKYRFLLGGVLLAGAISYLIYSAASSTSVYYLTLAEFMPQREALADEGVRVAGRVRSGSVQWDPRNLDLAFKLGDFEVESTLSVPVTYRGLLPDMFAEGRDVIVEGKYNREGVFQAHTVLTSCPSKYEAEDKQQTAKR